VAVAQVRLEFTVEPIVPGRPGPHVHAAIGAVQARGLPVDIGPFSSIAEGDGNDVAEALHDLVSAALANGASRLFVQVERVEDDR
jgi:uncharacterized protein YqgV (UPF0045/DUF77 family)